jgi:hypothetical protein
MGATGPIGPVGARGPQGFTGEQGDKGGIRYFFSNSTDIPAQANITLYRQSDRGEGQWDGFLQNNAVWNKVDAYDADGASGAVDKMDASITVDILYTGVYTIQFDCDDLGNVKVDGTAVVASPVGGARTNNRSPNYTGTPNSGTIALTAGTHLIEIHAENTQGYHAGWTLMMYDVHGNRVLNTGDLANGHNTGITDGEIRYDGSGASTTGNVYVSRKDIHGIDFGNFITQWDDANNPFKGQLLIKDNYNQGINSDIFNIIGNVRYPSVDIGSNFYSVPVEYIDGGNFINGTQVVLEFIRSGDKGELTPWIHVNENYQANNRDQILANTYAGTFTITLPSNPIPGWEVVIGDGGYRSQSFYTNNVLVVSPDETIADDWTELDVDLGNTITFFLFDGTTWQVEATAGPQGAASTVPGPKGDIVDTVYDAGNTGSNVITLDRANGTAQLLRATGNFTLEVPRNMDVGASLTVIITQDNTGHRVMTPAGLFKFASGYKLLSAAPGATDILSIFNSGVAYYVTITQGYE